jgi:uncharacterized protein (UPF0276 family)
MEQLTVLEREAALPPLETLLGELDAARAIAVRTTASRVAVA